MRLLLVSERSCDITNDWADRVFLPRDICETFHVSFAKSPQPNKLACVGCDSRALIIFLAAKGFTIVFRVSAHDPETTKPMPMRVCICITDWLVTYLDRAVVNGTKRVVYITLCLLPQQRHTRQWRVYSDERDFCSLSIQTWSFLFPPRVHSSVTARIEFGCAYTEKDEEQKKENNNYFSPSFSLCVCVCFCVYVCSITYTC